MAFSEDADEFHHLDSRECVSPFVLVSWKDCNKLPQTVQLKTSETSFKLTSGKMCQQGTASSNKRSVPIPCLFQLLVARGARGPVAVLQPVPP